jgi:hypothetical protein
LFAVDDRGRIKRIKSAANRASTPPNLFGMDRRIAYTHRKYHSGLIWIGVTNGFAIKKFSGSVSKFGINNTRVININREII